MVLNSEFGFLKSLSFALSLLCDFECATAVEKIK